MGDIMDFLKYGSITLLGITVIVILILAMKSRKPLRFLLLNAFWGVFALFLMHFTKRFTGVSLPINEYTVISSSFLGIPAVIGFLILNFILM